MAVACVVHFLLSLDPVRWYFVVRGCTEPGTSRVWSKHRDGLCVFLAKLRVT